VFLSRGNSAVTVAWNSSHPRMPTSDVGYRAMPADPHCSGAPPLIVRSDAVAYMSVLALSPSPPGNACRPGFGRREQQACGV